MKLRHQGTVEQLLPTPPDAVSSVLADPTRIGEWSSECRTGEWLDGASGPVVGARAWPKAATSAIFDYIEGWYNTRRHHSTLGYLRPAQYESTIVPTTEHLA